MACKPRTVLWIVVGILLFTAALRIQHVVDFVEWPDEIRSLWRTQYDLQNFLMRNPSDWPPLYGGLLWGWVRIAGGALESARMLSVLAHLLGAALIYRAALRMTKSIPAALLTMLVFATLGYLIFSGVDVRAYGILLALGAGAFWQTLRWLDHPNLRKSALLAFTLALMFHTSFTVIPYIAFLTLVVLVLRPRHFLLWVALGVGVLILCVPVLPQFFNSSVGRISSRLQQDLPDLAGALIQIYRDFGGSVLYLGVMIAALVLVIWRGLRQPSVRIWTLLLVVWLLFPIAVYIVTDNQEFMKPRYMWWVALGIALLIGNALLALPRRGHGIALIGVLLLALVPVDFDAYRLAPTTAPPMRATFDWLADRLRPGDVLVIDPHCTCGEPFAWDTFVPQYFPTGYLPIVEHPGTSARVWYLSTTGWERDEALLAAVQQGRKPSEFFGPWFFLLQLYEGPPSWEGASFGGRIRLHGAEIERSNTIMARDERFHLKLWWSAEQSIDADYSISVALFDRRGTLVLQADGAPAAADTPAQTSQWQPGVYYEDFRDFHLPPDIEDGDYLLVVTVYQWWDGVRLVPATNSLWATFNAAADYLLLYTIRVVS